MLPISALLMLFLAGFLAIFLSGVLVTMHVSKRYIAALAAFLVFTGSSGFFYMTDSVISVGALIFSGFMGLFVGATVYLCFTFVKVDWPKRPSGMQMAGFVPQSTIRRLFRIIIIGLASIVPFVALFSYILSTPFWLSTIAIALGLVGFVPVFWLLDKGSDNNSKEDNNKKSTKYPQAITKIASGRLLFKYSIHVLVIVISLQIFLGTILNWEANAPLASYAFVIGIVSLLIIVADFLLLFSLVIPAFQQRRLSFSQYTLNIALRPIVSSLIALAFYLGTGNTLLTCILDAMAVVSTVWFNLRYKSQF